jgi:hypothetical protein
MKMEDKEVCLKDIIKWELFDCRNHGFMYKYLFMYGVWNGNL